MRHLVRLAVVWLSRQIARIDSVIVAENNSYLMTKLQSCGRGVHFHGRVKIIAPSKVNLANNVHLGNNAYLDGRGGITIGENTHISRNFVVHSASHDYQGTRLPYDDVYVYKPIVIGRNVWIGTNVVVIPGVTIGEGAIIGAGAVVSKSVPPLAIVGSQPLRVLKYRPQSHYDRLDAAKSYGGVMGRSLEPSVADELQD
ncbi:MAG: acyltransferase [Cyanobacteria bacterium J06623_7]